MIMCFRTKISTGGTAMWLVPTVNVLFLTSLVMAQAGGDEKPVRYAEKASGFSFVPPRNWKVTELAGFKNKIVVGPAVDGFAPNMVFIDEAFVGQLKEYAAGNKSALQAHFKGAKVLSETELKTAEEIACARLVIEHKIESKLIRQSFYF